MLTMGRPRLITMGKVARIRVLDDQHCGHRCPYRSEVFRNRVICSLVAPEDLQKDPGFVETDFRSPTCRKAKGPGAKS